MNNKFILALDQGSSSSRVLAFDENGQVVAQLATPVETVRPAAGLAEINAEGLLLGQLNLLKQIIAQVGAENVASLSVTSQRSTIVFWDKLTGKPLMPALSWQDGRAIAQIEAVNLSQETVHSLTGLYKTPFYSAAKIKWAVENVPAVRQAAQEGRLCAGPTASYIIWHLTGGRVFACDPTLAQRTLLFNLHTLTWDKQLLSAFGINPAWLPQIKRTCDDYGVWEEAGQRMAIRVCVGDQQAALCALRVVSGGACINYGTGAFFMRNTGSQCHLLPGLLTSVAASTVHAGEKSEFLLEGPLNACGSVFTWLNALGIAVHQEELDAVVAQAKQPIWCLPALGGLGAPYWDFSASPVMADFTPHTTQADIVAGVVKGLAYLMADIVFYAERFGVKSSDIKVSGGLSKSHALLQAQADILQMRLLPCVESESTATGAALLAAEELGTDTSRWETLRLLPAIKPQLEVETAEDNYRAWHQFLNWCKVRKNK